MDSRAADDGSTKRSVLLYGGIAAMAVGAIGIAFAVWQGAEASSLSDDVQRAATQGSWAQDTYDSAKRSERAAIALYVSGGVAFAAGTVMMILGLRTSKTPHRAQRLPKWQLSAGPGGAMLRTTF